MNGEEQQQDTPFINPYVNAMNSDMENSLKYQLDPEDLIRKLKFIFLGYDKIIDVKTNEEKWVKDENSLPDINEMGWKKIEPYFRAYFDKTYPMSDLDDEKIAEITLSVASNLRDEFSLNFQSGNPWEVPDLYVARKIKLLICDGVYATLRKAHLRGYQNFLKTVQRIQEVQAFKGNLNQYNQPTQQQEAGFSKIPVLGKLFK